MYKSFSTSSFPVARIPGPLAVFQKGMEVAVEREGNTKLVFVSFAELTYHRICVCIFLLMAISILEIISTGLINK